MVSRKVFLCITIIIILIIIIIGILFVLYADTEAITGIGNYALVLTLIAIGVYSYFTYWIAIEPRIPCASFLITQFKNNPYIILFHLQNHTKVSIKCLCNLNVTIEDKPVILEGFYGCKSSFDLQPFGLATGNFKIEDILVKANTSIDSMKKKANADNVKKLLYFRIEFKYSAIDKKVTYPNPIQPYYFDFATNSLVMDF